MLDGQPPRIEPDGVPIGTLPEDLAPRLSETELVADIWAADAREARYVAERAASIAALARRRRIECDLDRGPLGGPGLDSRYHRSPVLAEVSETFVTELALIRHCTEHEAEALAVESLLLTTKLTGTWSALHDGRLDVRKMRALVDLLGPVTPAVTARIEPSVLPGAETLTVTQLRARVRRALARLDAEASEERRAEAARRAGVSHQPTGDGMSRFVVDMPLPQAAACVDAIDQYAQLLRADGDRRPIGVLRAAVATDLILRPWDVSRPPITAQLVVHAPLAALSPTGGEPPADVAGEVVTAAQCRELLEQLDMLGLRAAPTGGVVQVAVGDPITGRLVAVATRNEVRRAAGARRRRTRRSEDPARGGGTPDQRPGLRPPGGTHAYRPTASQKRFVRTRDRSCRMPGCRRRPGRCDIDHGIPHADSGPTECWNLCCLCRRHHRIKTFARGWRFELLRDGRLVVRTPSGVARTTWPPGWCSDPEPDPPWVDEEAPPDRLRG